MKLLYSLKTWFLNFFKPTIADENYILRRFRNKKKNAFRCKIPFEMTYGEFRSIFKSTKCFYTGVEMDFSNNTENVTIKHMVSIERIDNNLGYVAGNVVLCSRHVNNLKGKFETLNCRAGFEGNLLGKDFTNKQLESWNFNKCDFETIRKIQKSLRHYHGVKV